VRLKLRAINNFCAVPCPGAMPDKPRLNRELGIRWRATPTSSSRHESGADTPTTGAVGRHAR
jgi:hypothetical protein